MSRWRMMVEAILLYVGGLNMGAYGGYRLVLSIQGEVRPGAFNPFVGSAASALPLILIFLSAILGPFALQAVIQKWRILTYPVLGLCGAVVAFDIYQVVRVAL